MDRRTPVRLLLAFRHYGRRDYDSTVFDGDISGRTVRKNFSSVLSATAGDTLDFTVGLGANRTNLSDTTAIDVQLRRLQPTVPASLSIHHAVEVNWQTQTNQVYQVQWAFEVDTNTWYDFGRPVIGEGTEVSVFDATRGRPRRFYRLLTLE
jgi:hypothetical protein